MRTCKQPSSRIYVKKSRVRHQTSNVKKWSAAILRRASWM